NMTLTRTRGLARQKGVGREAFELKRERRMAVDVTERGQPSLSDAMEGLRRTARSAARHARRLALPSISALAAFAATAAAARDTPPVAGSTPVLVAPGEMRAGSLLLKSAEEGRYVEAPRLGTDVDIVVSGPTGRARITQIFQNPTDGWVEAVYVYPLPEGG